MGDAFGVELTVERAADVAWLHPGIAAYILCKGERVGVFGKLANDVTAELKLPKDSRSNLNIYLGEIDWVAFHALVPTSLHYTPIPEFAPVQRDLALVAPESMECGTLITEMQCACKQLTRVELFDIYRGVSSAITRRRTNTNVCGASVGSCSFSAKAGEAISRVTLKLSLRGSLPMARIIL